MFYIINSNLELKILIDIGNTLIFQIGKIVYINVYDEVEYTTKTTTYILNRLPKPIKSTGLQCQFNNSWTFVNGIASINTNGSISVAVESAGKYITSIVGFYYTNE